MVLTFVFMDVRKCIYFSFSCYIIAEISGWFEAYLVWGNVADRDAIDLQHSVTSVDRGQQVRAEGS